jgi:hypothetical protein
MTSAVTAHGVGTRTTKITKANHLKEFVVNFVIFVILVLDPCH